MEGKMWLGCVENKKGGIKIKEGKREEEGNKQANSHLCQDGPFSLSSFPPS